MKLRIGTLVAATMLTLTACGSITAEEWKAKVDALEAHEYKTCVVNGEVSEGGESMKIENVGFSYVGNGQWTSNDAYASVVEDMVGMNAKGLSFPEMLGYTYTYGSDLSVKVSMSQEMSGASMKGEGKMEFDKYGYLVKYVEEETVSYQGKTMSGKVSFTFAYAD